MKRKIFKVKDICYNKSCKHNCDGFCSLRGVTPGTCISSHTKEKDEMHIKTLEDALDGCEQKINELNAKIYELEGITPFGHLMMYIEALEKSDLPISREIQKIIKGVKFQDEIRKLNDRWDELYNWLDTLKSDIVHATILGYTPSAGTTILTIQDKMKILKKGDDHE